MAGLLVNPCCLAFGPDGLLWVRADVRYSPFRLGAATAEYEREVRLGHTGIGMLAPITFDGVGRLVDVGTLTSSEGSPLFVRLHRDPTGAVDTVAMADPPRQATGLARVSRVLGDSPVTFFLLQVYGPTWMQAHGPGGVWAEDRLAWCATGGEGGLLEGGLMAGASVRCGRKPQRVIVQHRDEMGVESIDVTPFAFPG